ncbi:MAG: hypothetical protein HYU97_01885 [Deltaproteobacteria bacterium]|nr:hypothetical protein [Deltaproteobacteria bacterium]
MADGDDGIRYLHFRFDQGDLQKCLQPPLNPTKPNGKKADPCLLNGTYYSASRDLAKLYVELPLSAKRAPGGVFEFTLQPYPGEKTLVALWDDRVVQGLNQSMRAVISLQNQISIQADSSVFEDQWPKLNEIITDYTVWGPESGQYHLGKELLKKMVVDLVQKITFGVEGEMRLSLELSGIIDSVLNLSLKYEDVDSIEVGLENPLKIYLTEDQRARLAKIKALAVLVYLFTEKFNFVFKYANAKSIPAELRSVRSQLVKVLENVAAKILFEEWVPNESSPEDGKAYFTNEQTDLSLVLNEVIITAASIYAKDLSVREGKGDGVEEFFTSLSEVAGIFKDIVRKGPNSAHLWQKIPDSIAGRLRLIQRAGSLEKHFLEAKQANLSHLLVQSKQADFSGQEAFVATIERLYTTSPIGRTVVTIFFKHTKFTSAGELAEEGADGEAILEDLKRLDEKIEGITDKLSKADLQDYLKINFPKSAWEAIQDKNLNEAQLREYIRGQFFKVLDQLSNVFLNARLRDVPCLLSFSKGKLQYVYNLQYSYNLHHHAASRRDMGFVVQWINENLLEFNSTPSTPNPFRPWVQFTPAVITILGGVATGVVCGLKGRSHGCYASATVTAAGLGVSTGEFINYYGNPQYNWDEDRWFWPTLLGGIAAGTTAGILWGAVGVEEEATGVLPADNGTRNWEGVFGPLSLPKVRTYFQFGSSF